VVLDGTDTIVLTVFSTLTNVSIYSVYHMIIYGMMQLYRAATSGFHAIVGNLWAKQDMERLNQVFGCVETVLHYAVVFLFSCTAALLLPFVRIYTAGISDADYIQPLFAVLLIFAHAFHCLRSIYNMLILGAGHYKQTQSCHIIAAILNLVISIVTVKFWGLIGVAIGTLVALAYQTIWMAIYDSRHLLKWPIKHFVKHIIVDILTALIIVFASSKVCWEVTGYFEWFTMAFLVSGIALVIVGLSVVVFYKKQLKDFKELLVKKYKSNRSKTIE
jgi:O-antigen/teichoic acid export membrane protein